jgi:hypothetical protein
MALTFGRWGGQTARPAYQEPYPRPLAQPGQPADDYILETEVEASRPPVRLQILRVLQALLIVGIALLSLAVFWMIGLIIGIF